MICAAKGAGLRFGFRTAYCIGFSLLLVVWSPTGLDAGNPTQLRRAFVPAGREDVWPTGEWERIPLRDLAEFEQAYAAGQITSDPPPQIERIIFRGTLTEPTALAGSFTAHVRRFDPNSAFM